MSLPEREATTDGRSGRGRNGRIQRVNVEAQVNRVLAPRVDMVERHLDDAPDAVLVDLVHAVCLDAVLLEDAALALVDVTKADVHEPVWLEERLHPRELVYLGPDPKQEREGHTVDVPYESTMRGERG